LSTRLSILFLVLSVALATASLAVWDLLGWWTVVVLYAAASCLLLSLAYAGAGARLLGKRPDGRLGPLSWILFGPYHGLNTVIFNLYRFLDRDPPFARVAPNLDFGRRLTAGEAGRIEDRGWVGVLDLAAEFGEVRPLRHARHYRSMPVLDGTAPTPSQLREAVAWLIAVGREAPVFVHCALGHGRSASVVVAYLLSNRYVTTIREGEALLQSLRPGVKLNRRQVGALRAFEPRFGDDADSREA
jgi:hypothetical protein